MDQVKLFEAYALLVSMREHLPGRIPPRLADEFHAILTQLEQHAGVTLNAFRIPAETIHPTRTQQHDSEWGGTYSSVIEGYCEREAFLMKLDAVLRMFQLLDAARASGKTPIGFRPPQSDE